MFSTPHPSVCFYFQVHQPYRLKDLRITDIGSGRLEYFDDDKNRSIFRKVAKKCYLPTNALMRELLHDNPEFRVAYSLSGVFLDQCREYGPDVLESFTALAATGQVEFLAETYYHSLASLSSLREFCEQVEKHALTIRKLFGCKPTVFRNTELIYSNELAQVVRLLGFQGILAEGADHVLRGRSPNHLYRPPSFMLPRDRTRIIGEYRVREPKRQIGILLKNYTLSDDIAFRFGNRQWTEYPLTANKFTEWIRSALSESGHGVNLFMDYETFGEHQWADTGIFDFLRALPRTLSDAGIAARTPSQAIKAWGRKPCDVLDVHTPISWADIERDLSAWRGNHLQEASFAAIYSLEDSVKRAGSAELLDTWRKLQTSDHFYYLCTKYWNDGDVHKYFSPYESPYEAYRRYSHAICDLRLRLENLKIEN